MGRTALGLPYGESESSLQKPGWAPIGAPKAYLEPSEGELLEGAARNLRDSLLIRFLFRLGCRVSEAVALRAEDVDLDSGTVRVLHLKERLRLFCPGYAARLGRAHQFCPGCGKEVPEPAKRLQEVRRQRILPLDPGTLEMLRDYIRRGGPVTKNGSNLLFAINRAQAWRVVRECARRAGLPLSSL